jgi:hypothetical protein
MKYTGQSGRSFRTCFQEHLRDFKHGNGKLSFAQHLLENGHAIGPIEDIMRTIYITNKGRLMDTGKILHIPRGEDRHPDQRQTSHQTQCNFQDNSSKRSPQRDAQHSPHGMNSPHLSRTRAVSVNTQTTTATTSPGINHLQPPYAAVHHDTSFHIVNYNPKTCRVCSHSK